MFAGPRSGQMNLAVGEAHGVQIDQARRVSDD